MKRNIFFIATLSALLLFNKINAQWTNDIAVNTPVAAEPMSLWYKPLSAIPDGEDGMIITWEDSRVHPSQIYVQRVDKDGFSLWGMNGMVVCSVPGYQYTPRLTSDGDGGAIIVWSDGRNGTDDNIYAQHITKNGIKTWDENGVLICGATRNQANPYIVFDGTGGAIITWDDYRSGSQSDLYARKINASGSLLGPEIALSTSTRHQVDAKIVEDGSGGAHIVWYDKRHGSSNIYTQHINAHGNILGSPGGDPIVIPEAGINMMDHDIVYGGNGDVIITWVEESSYFNTSTPVLYAQKIRFDGTRDWGINGRLVRAFVDGAFLGSCCVPKITTDGAGGAFITWVEGNFWTEGNYGVFVQRVSRDGDNLWPTALTLCDSPGASMTPKIASDGSGNALISYIDNKEGGWHVYAQKVDGNGNQKWDNENCSIVSTSEIFQAHTLIMPGGNGVIVAFNASRNEGTLYAQSLNAENGKVCDMTVTVGDDAQVLFGYPGSNCLSKTATVTGGTGPFSYSWSIDRPFNLTSGESLSGTTIATAVACMASNAMLKVDVADSKGCTASDDANIVVTNIQCSPGSSSVPGVWLCHNGKTQCFTLTAAAARLRLGDALGPCPTTTRSQGQGEQEIIGEPVTAMNIYPNPSNGNVTVTVNSPEIEVKSGTLRIINQSGQVVKTMNITNHQKINLSIEKSGVYFAQLVLGNQVMNKKLVLVR